MEQLSLNKTISVWFTNEDALSVQGRIGQRGWCPLQKINYVSYYIAMYINIMKIVFNHMHGYSFRITHNYVYLTSYPTAHILNHTIKSALSRYEALIS